MPSWRRTRSGCSPRCWSPRTGASSTPDLERRLRTFLAGRELFPPELLDLADRAIEHGELSAADADRYLELAAASFALSTDPVDRAWYQELERVSGVAADIGGVTTTHINHLTPRVLDIDDLYASMQARGIEMIDEIQGPPRWDGPDVLLRQTSFRALAEPRTFRDADGRISQGALRVRFGEVEARGIALTPAGRNRYDELVAAVDRPSGRRPGPRVAPTWHRRSGARACPPRSATCAWPVSASSRSGSTTEPSGARPPEQRAALDRGDVAGLVRAGVLHPEPIVYEDFLPRSAAGIFASNLTDGGTVDADQGGAERDAGWMADVMGRRSTSPRRSTPRRPRRPSVRRGRSWAGSSARGDAPARRAAWTVVRRMDPSVPLRRAGAMTETSLDELGPVDYVVVEFPAGASSFTGEMATELVALVDSGTIRLIDVLILTKAEDGSVEAMELSDIEELGELQALEAELAELLAEDDVLHLAAAMDPGSTAGVLIWENLWAAPFASAARRSGGQLIADGRIPIQAIIASIEADDELATEGA